MFTETAQVSCSSDSDVSMCVVVGGGGGGGFKYVFETQNICKGHKSSNCESSHTTFWQGVYIWVLTNVHMC